MAGYSDLGFPFNDEDLDPGDLVTPQKFRSAYVRGRQPLTTPSSGVETPPAQPGANPLIAEYRAKALEALTRSQQYEPTAAEQQKANERTLLALTLGAMGGESFRPAAGQLLKQALADPEAARDRHAKRLEAQAKIFESMALAEQTDATRRALAHPPADPLVQVQNTDGTITYVPRSQAPGMQAPPRGTGRGQPPGGRQLSPSAVNQISADESRMSQFTNLRDSWRPEYGGMGTGVGNLSGRYNPLASEQQRAQSQWWQYYQEFVNDMRHGQFGSALTPTEKAEFEKAMVTPNTDPRMISAYLERQLKIAENARQRRLENFKRGGYDVSGFGDQPGV